MFTLIAFFVPDIEQHRSRWQKVSDVVDRVLLLVIAGVVVWGLFDAVSR